MPVRTLFFRRFLPDRSIFDTDATHVARNVLPVAGTYRPLPQIRALGALAVSSTTIDNPITSAIAHLYQPSAPVQRIRPDERTGATNWVLFDRSTLSSDDDLTQQQKEAEQIGTEFYDDGTFLVSPGAATTETAEFTVYVAQQPPTTASSHHIFLRYKIVDPDDTNAWTVKLRLKGNAGTIATATATGTGEADWATLIATLSAGEMGNLIAGDFTTEDQMTLEIEATIAGSNATVDPDADIQKANWIDEGGDTDDLYGKLTDASDSTYIDSPSILLGGQAPIQFGLATAQTPASFSNLAAIIKWKGTNAGIKTDFELYSQGVLVAKLSDAEPPTALSSQTKTLTVESGVEFPDVDWDDLELAIVPRYPKNYDTTQWATYRPAADVDTGDWTSAPLFSKINDDDDGTQIDSPSMVASVDESFTIDLDTDPDVSGVTNRERRLTVRAQHDSSSVEQIKVEVLENGVAVESRTFSIASGSGWVNNIWRIDNIFPPNTDVDNTGWSTEPLATKLDDDANTIASSGTAGDNFTVGLPTTVVDPETNSGFLTWFRAWVSAGGTEATIQLSLLEDGTLIETAEVVSITDSEDVYVVSWSDSAVENISDFTKIQIKVSVTEAVTVTMRRLTFEAPSAFSGITDYSAMRVKVTAVGSARAGWQMSCSNIELAIAAARSVQIAELDLQTDPTSFVQASWAQFQVPEASSDSQAAESDRIALIAARRKRIYWVRPRDTAGTVFNDISKGAADLSAGAYPWDFATWGQQLLATNKSEEVQKFDPDTDSATSDLITSADKPKGRFGQVARDQYILANISFGGSPAGFSDEVWGSAIDDAADFDDSSTTSGCFRQRIRQVPGEITALEGGGFILVWKRVGMVRGDWIDSPFWWDFDNVVSYEVGTTQPQAVVRVGREFYFPGSDGRFYRTTGFEEPEAIDDGLHYAFSPPHGIHRIRSVASNSPFELENRIVGGYDRGTKCVVWIARSPADAAFRNLKIITYNVVERRFSTGILNPDEASSGISCLVSLLNVEHDAAHQMYGLGAFTYDGSNDRYMQWTGPDEAVTISTPVYPIDPESDMPGYVHRVRPFYRMLGMQALRKVDFSVVLRTWDDYSTEENYRTGTMEGRYANDAGWVETDDGSGSHLKGRFVQAELTLARAVYRQILRAGTYLGGSGLTLPNPPIRELLGVQIDVDTGER